VGDDLATVVCYDLGDLGEAGQAGAKDWDHTIRQIIKTARSFTMARKQASNAAAAATSAGRSQSGEIALLISASQFVRAAGGWRAAEDQLRAVQNFVNSCGGFDKATEMLASLEAIRTNLDGLAEPEGRGAASDD
jgi:hypothetical protein